MKLEQFETLCLNYLRQTKNLLVPVSRLLEQCRREENCAELTKEVLLDFLRTHDEIIVIDGPGYKEGVGTDAFSAAGFDMGVRAILKMRVPSKSEMAKLMDKQLQDMVDVLVKTRMEAEIRGDTEIAIQMNAALERIGSLRERVEGLPKD